MHKIIEVKQNILADNDADAAALREQLRVEKTFFLNLMSSPGSGKTCTLKRTITALKDEFHMGIIEADIDSDVDAAAIEACGIPVIQVHTGGMCHLDCAMSRQGLSELGTSDKDLVILENIGNLVCPAEFDTGAIKNVMILSVPEGHDKPLKYPLMFKRCDVMLINKMDVLSSFDFDLDKVSRYARQRNPNIQIFPISAKTGAGMDAWFEWLRNETKSWIA